MRLHSRKSMKYYRKLQVNFCFWSFLVERRRYCFSFPTCVHNFSRQFCVLYYVIHYYTQFRQKMWTFNDIFKSTIWGGQRIPALKHVTCDLPNVGESWEISNVPGSESVVVNGSDKGLTLTQLIDKYGADLMGHRNYEKFGNSFPLLIKFIDAAQDLSVQVHPDDELAAKRDGRNGKTEMWYVIDADKDARLANGFINPVDPADYRRLVETGDIEKVLRFCPIHPGDVFFIPAKRVHAIGKGALVAEIQQTSDTTYRLYDYHRKDAQGKERELHTDLAFDSIDFNDTAGAPVEYKLKEDIPVNVVDSPFFTTNVMRLDEEVVRDYRERDTFVILIAIGGAAEITCGQEHLRLEAGHTVLIPASANGVTINPDGEFTALETYIR